MLFFFPIISVFPAAFGKHNISVKVVESLLKKIFIKALCTGAGGVPKVTCCYEKHGSVHYTRCSLRHTPLLGGKGGATGFHRQQTPTPDFPSSCPILELLTIPRQPPSLGDDFAER